MNIAADTSSGLGRGHGEAGRAHHGSLVSRILPGAETHALIQVLPSLVQPAYRGRERLAAHRLVLIYIHAGTCIQGYKYIVRTQAGDVTGSAE